MADQATASPGMVPGYRQPVLRIVILAPVGATCFALGIPIELIVFGLLLGAYKGPQWTTTIRNKIRSSRQFRQDHSEGASDGVDELERLREEKNSEANKSKGAGAWRSRTMDDKKALKATGKPADDSKSWRSKPEERPSASSPLSALKKAKGPQLQWRSIINKFTPEKFDKLTEQLLDTLPKKPAEDEENAEPVNYKQVIDDMLSIVFEAASRQHQYTEMYTELCRKLLDYVVQQQPDFDSTSSVWEKCQKIFLSMVLTPVQIPDDLDEDEKMDRKMKHKHMMVGTVKFGGDLVGHGLVPCDGVMRWIHALLSDKQFLQEDIAGERKASTADEMGEEVDDQLKEKDREQRETQLECTLAILASMGPSLSDSNTWNEENRSMMEDVFSQLEQMSMDSSSLSLRIRCLIRDILDLRIANWKEKEGVMKPQRLESRDKKEEDEQEEDNRDAGSLRSSAPEFVPGGVSKSNWFADKMDQGKQWLDPQLLGSLTAVEHHVEVIEDKDTKVARLKSLVQLYHLINGQQIVIVANSSNIRRVIELFEESFKEVPHSALDFNTSEVVRKKSIVGFERGEIAILIMASEVSTRRDFEIGKAAPVLVNFDFPVTLQLYLYRIYKRADQSTHVYTFFSPQFDIRHTSQLIAAMELAKQKVPPALQKLKDHAPKPEYKREGKGGGRDGKGDMETGSSAAASSRRATPKAGEGDGKQLLDDGDATPKGEHPPWKKGEGRGGDTPSSGDRLRRDGESKGKGEGKGKGSRPMNASWRGERDSDWRNDEGRQRGGSDEVESTAHVVKPRTDRPDLDSVKTPEEMELRRARTAPDESQLRRRENARRPDGNGDQLDGQLRRRENARRGDADGENLEGNSHGDAWQSVGANRRRDDKPSLTPSGKGDSPGGKGDRRPGGDRGLSEGSGSGFHSSQVDQGFRSRRDGDPTTPSSGHRSGAAGLGRSGDDAAASSKGSRYHTDGGAQGKGMERPRILPRVNSGGGGPIRRGENFSPSSNERGGRPSLDDGSWGDRLSKADGDFADRGGGTPSNRGNNNNNYRHNQRRDG